MFRGLVVIFFIIFKTSYFFAQNNKIDSLKRSSLKQDTSSVINYRKIGGLFLNDGQNDSSFVYYQKSLKLARLLKDKKQISLGLKFLARYYLGNNEFDTSIVYYKRALNYFEELNNKKEISDCLFYLGRNYATMSDYTTALSYFTKALKINSAEGFFKDNVKCQNALGIIYNDQLQYQKAINALKEGIKISVANNIESEYASLYSNIGYAYLNSKKLDSALKYHLLSYNIGVAQQNEHDIGISSLNLANIYYDLNDFKKSLFYIDRAIYIFNKSHDEYSMVEVYQILGFINFEQHKYTDAKNYFLKNLEIATRLRVINLQRAAYEKLASCEFELKNYKEAFQYQVKFSKLTDSIFNVENSKQLGDLKTNFEVEKKEAELKIKSELDKEKLRAVAKEQQQKQQVIIVAVFFVLLVVIVFSIFLYRRYKITQKQKIIIELKEKETQFQKEIVEEKQREILDSIYYAKRIQQAILPNEKFIEKQLNKKKKL